MKCSVYHNVAIWFAFRIGIRVSVQIRQRKSAITQETSFSWLGWVFAHCIEIIVFQDGLSWLAVGHTDKDGSGDNPARNVFGRDFQQHELVRFLKIHFIKLKVKSVSYKLPFFSFSTQNNRKFRKLFSHRKSSFFRNCRLIR